MSNGFREQADDVFFLLPGAEPTAEDIEATEPAAEGEPASIEQTVRRMRRGTRERRDRRDALTRSYVNAPTPFGDDPSERERAQRRREIAANVDAGPTTRLRTARPTSPLHAGLMGAAQGASMGFSDEMAAAAEAPFSDDDYRTILERNRQTLRELEEDHPRAYYGSELGGGVLAAALTAPGAVAGQTMRQAAAQGMRQGAAYGGIGGTGYSEGETVGEIGGDALFGATVGGGLGGAAAPVARYAGEAAGRLGSRWLERGNLLRLRRAGSRHSQLRDFERMPGPQGIRGPVGGPTRGERIAVELSEMQTPRVAGQGGEPVFGRLGMSSDELVQSRVGEILAGTGEVFEAVFEEVDELVDVRPIIGRLQELRHGYHTNGRPNPNSRRLIRHIDTQLAEFGRHADDGLPLQQAQQSINLLDQQIQWARDPRSRSIASELNADIRRAVRGGMDDAVERSALGAEGRAAYQQARRQYQVANKLREHAAINRMRDAGNRQVSLSDYVAASGAASPAAGAGTAVANRAFRANEARILGEAQRRAAGPMIRAGQRATESAPRAAATMGAAGEGPADAIREAERDRQDPDRVPPSGRRSTFTDSATTGNPRTGESIADPEDVGRDDDVEVTETDDYESIFGD